MIRGGGVRPKARRMPDWAMVDSVVWMMVPAGPASVIVPPTQLPVDPGAGSSRCAVRRPGSVAARANRAARGRGCGFDPVEHRAQLDGGLQVAEPPFGFEQVLVAQRDVLGRQVRLPRSTRGTSRRTGPRRRSSSGPVPAALTGLAPAPGVPQCALALTCAASSRSACRPPAAGPPCRQPCSWWRRGASLLLPPTRRPTPGRRARLADHCRRLGGLVPVAGGHRAGVGRGQSRLRERRPFSLDAPSKCAVNAGRNASAGCNYPTLGPRSASGSMIPTLCRALGWWR